MSFTISAAAFGFPAASDFLLILSINESLINQSDKMDAILMGFF